MESPICNQLNSSKNRIIAHQIGDGMPAAPPAPSFGSYADDVSLEFQRQRHFSRGQISSYRAQSFVSDAIAAGGGKNSVFGMLARKPQPLMQWSLRVLNHVKTSSTHQVEAKS